MTSPTKETYGNLAKAYDHFNRALFNGELPPCLITFNRKRNAKGYFWGDTWEHATDKRKADEISLNPDTLKRRTLEEVLSTLVHEQCHLWQHHFGKTSRNGYHNKEWANKMLDCGLQASDTGLQGGKTTGQRVTHYIIPNGVYAACCAKLTGTGFVIPWLANTGEGGSAKKAKAKGTPKTKYSCPSCDLNVWGKADLSIGCLECEDILQAE